MPKFSKKSAGILKRADPDLQRVANEAIKEYDFSVICSVRSKQEQTRAYNAGKSRAKWGQSPHNFEPSLAIDIGPYPLDWNDLAAFERLGTVFLKHATKLGVSLEWGKHFTGLVDYPHFQLRDWKKRIPK
jgi:peptidoglycan L-alanyl-D-glutamate endopeptidase CwlK